jgi:hypothetical protein
MTTDERSKKAAQGIRDVLKHGKAGGVLPGESVEKAWKELEERVAEAVKPHLEDAYSQGRADAIQEAKRKQ